MAHSITQGYFSGKYILRVWGRDGETLHNSAHDTHQQADEEFGKYESDRKAKQAIDAEAAINDLPIISVRQGFEGRTGHATPEDVK